VIIFYLWGNFKKNGGGEGAEYARSQDDYLQKYKPKNIVRNENI